MTETADVSTETLRYMSIIAAVNCALAALGVAIAYYVYFYVPHSVEVHYTGKFGEVVSSAATYIGVVPALPILVVDCEPGGSLLAFLLWKDRCRRLGLRTRRACA